jgi:hypothetical protein
VLVTCCLDPTCAIPNQDLIHYLRGCLNSTCRHTRR